MKITLSVSAIADALRADTSANWSYAGAVALAEYLDEQDTQNEEDTEFDVVAIRCEFNEYSSALEAAKDQGFEGDEGDDEGEQEEKALAWLQDKTTVIEFKGGVIIQAY